MLVSAPSASSTEAPKAAVSTTVDAGEYKAKLDARAKQIAELKGKKGALTSEEQKEIKLYDQ